MLTTWVLLGERLGYHLRYTTFSHKFINLILPNWRKIYEAFQKNLEGRLTEELRSRGDSINWQWLGISNAIKSVAEETLVLQPRDHRSPWFDEYCLLDNNNKNEAYKIMTYRNTRRTYECYHDKKRRHRKKKWAWDNKNMTDIQSFRRSNQSHLLQTSQWGEGGDQPSNREWLHVRKMWRWALDR